MKHFIKLFIIYWLIFKIGLYKIHCANEMMSSQFSFCFDLNYQILNQLFNSQVFLSCIGHHNRYSISMKLCLKFSHNITTNTSNHIWVCGTLQQPEIHLIINIELASIILTYPRVLYVTFLIKVTLKVMIKSLLHFRDHVVVNPCVTIYFTL